MTLKQKIFLISAVCILFGGLLISYKSFQLNQNFRVKNVNENNREVAHWVAQTVEQKITHMESSVSYLDASTVETLKRMGARYFAYAYPVNDQWKIKWKVLGALDKDGITNEVNKITFANLPAQRRTWNFNSSGELILISPVELASSKQLKNGFLIFGLSDQFFSFISSVDPGVSLFSQDGQKIYGDKIVQAKQLGLLKASQDTNEPKFVTEAGVKELVTSTFAKPSQMWVIRAQKAPAIGYLVSSIFSYFLLAVVLAFGVLAVAIQRFLIQETVQDQDEVDFVDSPLMEKLRNTKQGAMAFVSALSKKKTDIASDETMTLDGNADNPVEIIENFSEFIDDIVSLERGPLNKLNISVKTQVEDGASVLCIPEHITDFMRRLIKNSMQSLKSESEKRIHIELVKQADNYQLMYVDTRRSHYPTGQDSVFLQNESSLETIDGVIAYGNWLFGKNLTVAQEGFCLSIDLKNAHAHQPPKAVSRVLPVAESDPDRIEIRDEDTLDLHFEKIATKFEKEPEAQKASEDEFSSQSIEDIVSSFEMKNFSFDGAEEEEMKPIPTVAEADDKGLFELNTGQFKIKIRSPKTKRDIDGSY